MKAVKQAVLTVLFLLIAGASHAITIQVTADVTDAGGDSPFELDIGDQITLVLTYDENDVAPTGADALDLINGDFQFTMSFPDGSSFSDTDLTPLEAAVTVAYFFNQLFDGFDFDHTLLDSDGDSINVVSILDGFSLIAEAVGSTSDFADATWDLASVQVVPLPAAVWFFGSALLGLGALRRVRRQPQVA